jgi:hypothetical protein
MLGITLRTLSNYCGLLTAFSFDFDKKHNHHEMMLRRAEIIGKYNITGRILLLPILGNGDLNITLGKLCLLAVT